MKTEIVYLDNCCFNRPFDDQSYEKILLETEAKLKIQEKIKNDEMTLVWSYMLDFENNENPNDIIKNAIFLWKELSKIDIIESEKLLLRAEEIEKLGISSKDAIHISCAIEANAEIFFTTDSSLIKKRAGIKEISIMNPVSFFVDKE